MLNILSDELEKMHISKDLTKCLKCTINPPYNKDLKYCFSCMSDIMSCQVCYTDLKKKKGFYGKIYMKFCYGCFHTTMCDNCFCKLSKKDEKYEKIYSFGLVTNCGACFKKNKKCEKCGISVNNSVSYTNSKILCKGCQT